MDIIMKHLGDERAHVNDGNPPTDTISLAMAINDELREKFITIAKEEIDAVEVETIGRGIGINPLSAGSGPEQESCGGESNPNWLHNRAINALALAEHLRRGQGIRLPDNSRGRAFAAAAPLIPVPKPDTTDVTVHLSGNPMLFYMGTDKTAYRLDGDVLPGSVGFPSGREAQLALALTDLSASRLHRVTQ